MTDPLREAISVSLIAKGEETDPAQTPPRAALPDVMIDVGTKPPEAAATSHFPCADLPPVVLEISSSSPEPSEPRRCPDTPGKWFGLQHEAKRDREPALLLLHAVLESDHLPLEGGASNGPLV